MKFEPYSYFAGVAKKVTGTITSKTGKVEWVLNGTWDSKLEGSRVIGESKSKGNLTRIRGTEYLIRVVNPSGLTRLTGYIRVNTLRLILVTTARLALSCRLCSAKGNALKYSKSCKQLLKRL